MKYLPIIIILFISNIISAQDEGLRYENYTYKPNIKTVQFHLDGLLTSYPIIDLNSNTPLLLSFDDLDGDAKNYTYTIVQCNMYWEPSNLSQMEYIDGFVEERIENFEFSFNTLQPYTHYRLAFPNNRMSFTKSGNYLLKIYDNEGRKSLAITRRFVVTEPLVRVEPRLVRPNVAGKMQTHQEIDFVIRHDQLKISRPMQEIRAAVLQNGRWDNAITDLPPFLFRPNELIYDYQDKIIFPAGKEFRPLDLRSMRFRAQGIASIEQTDNTYEITLQKDLKRVNDSYFQRVDIDGNFVIENNDRSNLDPDLTCNYTNVLFPLYSPEPFYDHDVYIIGAITEWQLKPEFKLVYNNSLNAYVSKVQLKQGYYDYMYGMIPNNKKAVNAVPDISEIEGNWFETENQYTILVYYRAFGERYDRVIGAVTFNSNL